MCDIALISFSSSVHKCWIAVARVIVFVYGPVCFYVHSCHIKALVMGWGECRGAFKDIPVTSVCEGRASPGLPPACPLDYCAISPHASAESLRDIRASISHMAALTPPTPLPPPRFSSLRSRRTNNLVHSLSVYVCMHTFFFFRWKLITITITGIQFESRPLPVAQQWVRELYHVFLKGHTPLYSSRCVKRGKSSRVLCSSEAHAVYSETVGIWILHHTVHFRNRSDKIQLLKRILFIFLLCC